MLTRSARNPTRFFAAAVLIGVAILAASLDRITHWTLSSAPARDCLPVLLPGTPAKYPLRANAGIGHLRLSGALAELGR